MPPARAVMDATGRYADPGAKELQIGSRQPMNFDCRSSRGNKDFMSCELQVSLQYVSPLHALFTIAE